MVDLSMAASKRHDPNYSQVSGYIPKPLALRFKGFVTMEDKEISQVLEELISEWVAKKEAR